MKLLVFFIICFEVTLSWIGSNYRARFKTHNRFRHFGSAILQRSPNSQRINRHTATYSNSIQIFSTNETYSSKTHQKKLFDSLLHYYNTYNTTVVKSGFVVPDDKDWSSFDSGYNLALALKHFQNKYNSKLYLNGEKSNEFKIQKKYRSNSFDCFIETVQLYMDLHEGSLIIPRNWSVPCKKPWPKDSWNMKLGSKVAAIRAGTIYRKPEQIERLTEIGFVWDPSANNVELFLEALKAYKSIYGCLVIPKSFIVPYQEPFPKATWGWKLGLKVGNYRYRGDYAAYRTKFEELGISDNHNNFDTRHWDHIYKALKVYKEIHGDLNIPASWSVPCREPWPRETWELKLGYRAHNIRYRGDFISTNSAYRVLLEDLGFKFRRGVRGGDDGRVSFHNRWMNMEEKFMFYRSNETAISFS